MSLDQQGIFSEALALPPDAREELAEKLWQSLDASRQDEVTRAWAEEIGRRLDAFERGEIKPIPGAEVLQSIREKLKQR